jgi:hypothetical protein
LTELKQSKPAATAALIARLGLGDAELRHWQQVAEKMLIPYSKQTNS